MNSIIIITTPILGLMLTPDFGIIKNMNIIKIIDRYKKDINVNINVLKKGAMSPFPTRT